MNYKPIGKIGDRLLLLSSNNEIWEISTTDTSRTLVAEFPNTFSVNNTLTTESEAYFHVYNTLSQQEVWKLENNKLSKIYEAQSHYLQIFKYNNHCYAVTNYALVNISKNIRMLNHSYSLSFREYRGELFVNFKTDWGTISVARIDPDLSVKTLDLEDPNDLMYSMDIQKTNGYYSITDASRNMSVLIDKSFSNVIHQEKTYNQSLLFSHYFVDREKNIYKVELSDFSFTLLDRNFYTYDSLRVDKWWIKNSEKIKADSLKLYGGHRYTTPTLTGGITNGKYSELLYSEEHLYMVVRENNDEAHPYVLKLNPFDLTYAKTRLNNYFSRENFPITAFPSYSSAFRSQGENIYIYPFKRSPVISYNMQSQDLEHLRTDDTKHLFHTPFAGNVFLSGVENGVQLLGETDTLSIPISEKIKINSTLQQAHAVQDQILLFTHVNDKREIYLYENDELKLLTTLYSNTILRSHAEISDVFGGKYVLIRDQYDHINSLSVNRTHLYDAAKRQIHELPAFAPHYLGIRQIIPYSQNKFIIKADRYKFYILDVFLLTITLVDYTFEGLDTEVFKVYENGDFVVADIFRALIFDKNFLLKYTVNTLYSDQMVRYKNKVLFLESSSLKSYDGDRLTTFKAGKGFSHANFSDNFLSFRTQDELIIWDMESEKDVLKHPATTFYSKSHFAGATKTHMLFALQLQNGTEFWSFNKSTHEFSKIFSSSLVMGQIFYSNDTEVVFRLGVYNEFELYSFENNRLRAIEKDLRPENITQGLNFWSVKKGNTTLIIDTQKNKIHRVNLNDEILDFHSSFMDNLFFTRFLNSGLEIVSQYKNSELQTPIAQTKWDFRYTPLGDHIYYPGDSEAGYELWEFNIKTQETRLYDLWKGRNSSSPDNLIVINNKLYSLASDERGLQLWEITSGKLMEENPEVTREVTLYPNPSLDFIRIRYTHQGSVSGVITIYDQTGRSPVLQLNYENSSLIDISRLAPGVYIVHLKTSNGNFYKRLVKV